MSDVEPVGAVKATGCLPPFNAAAALDLPVAGSEKVHVNIVVASLALGGAERVVRDLVIELGSRDATANLFMLSDARPGYSVDSAGGVRVFRLDGTERREKFKLIAREVLRSPSPILYAHLISAGNLEFLWGAGISTVPVIHNAKPGWLDPVSAYDRDCVPFVVAVSEFVARELQANGCPKPVVVIRHQLQGGPTAEDGRRCRLEIRRLFGISDDTLLVGMVGQFKAQKAYTRAVQVLGSLRRLRRTKLMILGGWNHDYGHGRVSYAATMMRAVDLGVEADLILPGAVPDAERFYPAFDVFLNTSIYEGLSISLLEALQNGCPVVAADAGGNGEVLPEEAELIDDPSDIAAYVSAVGRVTARPRPAVRRPANPDLIPRLWCMLARYGAPVRPRPGQESLLGGTLFVTDNLNPGGAQRSLTNLLCSLPRSEKTLLCILGKVYCEGYLREIQNASVPVFAIDCAKVPDSVERLLGLATNRAVSNICFWNVNAETKLLLTKVLALAPTQIVDVSPGPMLFRQLEGAKAFQQEICFSSAQYFSRLDHFVSKYRGGEPPPPYQMQPWKAVMIPNGVRVAASSNGPVASPVPGDPALRIGACCRIVPSNRLEFLIEMVALLIGRFPRVSLTVLGGLERSHRSYWDGLLGRIEAAGLNHIHFVGSQADVSTWLREFKVFVMISEEHGCPNASLEAMAAALPVVTNRVGGTPEQVLDGVNGFLVSDRDPSEMAERVAFLLANPVAAAAFGRAGMQLVQREFSIEKMVQRYVRLFRLGRPSA